MRSIKGVYATALFILTVGVLVAAPAFAQATRDGRVQVTVVDQSGGVVPGASVTLVGLETPTQAQAAPTATSGDNGIAVLERVAPGRYSVRAEFPGFDLGLLRDIRVRAGDNRHVVVLPLAKLETSVTVGRNLQEVAADRRSSQFGNSVAQQQLDSLSDDPAELQRQLQELAGPDAVIRIDSFEGQQLPPKAQIKSIHIVRDQFAAESADPGSTFVDIVTQPGIGPIRGALNLTFFDDALASKSPFVDTKPDEQSRQFGGNIGGALIQGKTSFSLNLNGQNQYSTPIVNVAGVNGTKAETLRLRAPREFLNVNGLVDHAMTKDQALRVSYSLNRQALRNLGIGNLRSARAGLRRAAIEQQHACPGSRSARSSGVHEHAVRLSADRPRSQLEHRGANDHRARRVQRRRCAGAAGHASAGADAGFGCRLRPGRPLVARRAAGGRELGAEHPAEQLPGHIHVQQSRRVCRRNAAALHADRR